METYALLTFMGGALVGVGALLFIIVVAVYLFIREEN
jgi:hypothetical protein